MTSKNNPARRGTADEQKTFDGKPVKPVLYVGSHVGHGRYMAAQDDGGKLVKDGEGKPIPFSQI